MALVIVTYCLIMLIHASFVALVGCCSLLFYGMVNFLVGVIIGECSVATARIRRRRDTHT